MWRAYKYDTLNIVTYVTICLVIVCFDDCLHPCQYVNNQLRSCTFLTTSPPILCVTKIVGTCLLVRDERYKILLRHRYNEGVDNARAAEQNLESQARCEEPIFFPNKHRIQMCTMRRSQNLLRCRAIMARIPLTRGESMSLSQSLLDHVQK